MNFRLKNNLVKITGHTIITPLKKILLLSIGGGSNTTFTNVLQMLHSHLSLKSS